MGNKDLEQIKLNGPGRIQLLAVREAYMATSWPTPGFKERTFDSSGFSTEGTSVSASAIPHCNRNSGQVAT